jgi:hypothetical protein
MNSPNPYLRAIDANLSALWIILAAAIKDVDHGLKAAGQGNQNGAVGSIIPTGELLKQAGILIEAITILHRQR